ncbi:MULTISPECIES: fimbrial protein [Pseudomonas]|uniref:fimbrial protein n=1 Tax=Pseudomonas TaxID=286 RepID=UPI00085422FE|nr:MULTISPECIES: fimbrial protein [Pseudomonas]MBQ56736.1 type 1 fimbrial protein [Pseudomonadaceae bacterium]OEO27431.1 hypothetical protein AX279_03925 [Pseudomonas sp. J237]SFT72433.1 Pilin (type 1 fimbria component protein) [Pseudomonas marincola]HCP53773.1 type 1 fimbrial protein [Pseudomonas sp.]
MKKAILTGAVIAAMTTMGAAHAVTTPNNTGQIKFTGAIAAASCDMNVVVSGVVQPGGVVDLGVWTITDVSAVGGFGNAVKIQLQPDVATCDVDPSGLTTAFIKIDTATTASSNTDVVTSPETATTKVGVTFTMEDDSSIVNQPGSALTLASDPNVDAATGAIKFKARPYALSEFIEGGIIGGSVNYTVAYN